MKGKSYILFTLLLFAFLTVFSQDLLEEEKNMFKEARKIFLSENYEESVRLFSHLSSVNNQNPMYKYYLGASFLKAKGENNKAIEYLEFASKSAEIPQEVFFYLANAYHLGNRFDDAISTYSKYKGMLSKSNPQIAFINRQIEMCNNAKVLVADHQKVLMTVKKEVENAPSYGHYDVSMIGGKVIKTPDHYKSKEDVKYNMNEVLFMTYNKDILFYSSKEDGSKSGQEIFLVKKLPDGEWGLPQNIGAPVNTIFDEDAPFLHPDGKTLYFSSKGHNSMGGFDIFRSEFVEEEFPKTGYWTQPENLGYPINSSDDDQFFVTDIDHEYAYFSSGRETSPGKMEVFKIKLPQKSIANTVIKGIFTNNSSKVPNKAKITVIDKKSETFMGVFNTDPANGEFLLILPPGKEYTYLIEAEGFTPRMQDIAIPPQFSFYELYQEIDLEGTKISENLAITNDFSNPYVKTELDEELAVLEEKSTGAEKISSKYMLADNSKLKTVELDGRMVVVPSIDNTTIEMIEEKELPVLALSRQEKLENAEKSANTEESNFLSESTNTNQSENKSAEKVYGKGEEYDKVSYGSIVLSEENKVDNLQQSPSVTIISTFADELRNSAQQNALDAEIAFANSQEVKSEADKLREEAIILEKSAYEIKNEKKKEEELEKVRKLESNARDKWQEARDSYDYAQNLQKESELKSEKASTADAVVLKIKKEQEKLGFSSEEKHQYTELQLQEIQSYTVEFSEELRKESNLKGQKAEVALNYAKKIRSNAQKKMDEASRLAVEAEKAKNSSKKESLQQESVILQKEADDLANESEIALSYSNELKNSSDKKLNESILLKKQAESIQQQNNSKTESITINEKVKEDLQASLPENNLDKVLTKEVEFLTKKEARKKSKTSSSQESNTKAVTKGTRLSKPDENRINSLTETETVSNNEPVNALNNERQEKKTTNADQSSTINENQQQANNLNKEGIALSADNNSNKNEVSENSDWFEESFLNDDTAMYEEDALLYKQKKSLKNKTNEESQINSYVQENKIDSTSMSNIDQGVGNSYSTNIVNKSTKISEKPSEELLVLNAKENINQGSNENENRSNIDGDDIKSEISTHDNENLNKDVNGLNSKPKETSTSLDANTAEQISETKENKALALNENNELDYENLNNSDAISEQDKGGVISQNEIDLTVINNKTISKDKEKGEVLKKESNSDNSTKNLELKASNKSQNTPQNSDYEKNESVIASSENTDQLKESQQNQPQENDSKKEKGAGFDFSIGSVFGKKEKNNSDVPATSSSNESRLANNKSPESEYSESLSEISSENINSSNSNLNMNTSENIALTNEVSENSVTTYNITPINIHEAALEIQYKKEEKLIVFSMKSETAYSEKKPIPINETLPEGLIFKVQIGAFKNTIPHNLFGGINPVMAENTPMGFKRYTAGLFRAYESANLARNEIRNIGFKDAFVVSFFNGKRITLSEALSILKSSSIDVQVAYKEISQLEKQALADLNIYDEKYASQNNVIPVKYELPEGTFFKVQIGAFSNPVSKDNFPQFNIEDISGDISQSGLIRYTLGLFNDFASADNYRNEFVKKHIPDAFVVVYRDGARVPLNEAFDVKSYLTVNKSNNNHTTEPNLPEKTTPKPEETIKHGLFTNLPSTSDFPVFMVQIGSFKNGIVPKKFMDIIEKIEPVYTEMTPNGFKRFLAEKYNDFESAEQKRDEYRSKGILDAYVVAYYNKERITIPEAEKIISNSKK